MDFDLLRQEMVDKQLIPRGINDEKVIEVFRQVPRHKFVPQEYQKSSYGDFPLPIGNNQTISQPYIVALMTQVLEIKDIDKVLEIGAGSGYQTAILASLAKDVYSVERKVSLAQNAEGLLKELGYQNIKIRMGDGTLGLEEFAPYDKIIVTAAAPSLPESLKKQLNDNGRIVIPISAGFGQMLSVFIKEKNKFLRKDICGCTFVPLIGKYGYK
ncbi:MAG: protein-L-isoaspartate(D-aspartate) O-methyltransferase [Candidatus Omnitrophica bacterium]|nr:protein-L-isoaspartate(D-aspartate) O-methyltransferase [Candidatus Omnitrophota bacterium]